MVKPIKSSKALILAAHGCSRDNGVSIRLNRIAARLGVGSVFDSVSPAFHKQPPYFGEVLDGLAADRVVVVPFMTSQGYFCRRVLPQQMGLIAPQTNRLGQAIHLTPPLGEHTRMPDLMADLVQSTLRTHELDASLTAVILVGHGTRRDAQSAQLTERHAAALRQRHTVGQVLAVYLDQPPELEAVYDLTDLPILVVVPYLIGGGRHAVQDLPARLGMERMAVSHLPGSFTAMGRRVYLTSSPFDGPEIDELVLELAQDALEASSTDPGPWMRRFSGQESPRSHRPGGMNGVPDVFLGRLPARPPRA